ncbi:queuosine salvage family protein [Acidobacteriia bacterium AH_259_A11_L15]|nr:queuosine salvage family protein [Acidobacteriia bacterium AH_259_A11_L15]
MPLAWPTTFDSPVLKSLRPVIAQSRHVRTHPEKIAEHAGWMAYEELPFPEFVLPFGLEADHEQTLDFILVSTCLNFAFTDFATHEVFRVDYAGKTWLDAEALFACMKRALDEGIPFLEGGYLRRVSRRDLEHIFRGPAPLPLLDDRVEILRSVGAVLAEQYGGRFYHFVQAGSPSVYHNGLGLLDRLVKEFPRFRDVSPYGDHQVKFYKLAQLGLWILHSALSRSGRFRLEDPERLTAFADYIVPAALRILGILSYSAELEETIQQRRLIPRDTPQEVEIRAHTLYATALLTEEVNRLRPADRQVIIPQIDARLWTHYHTTFWPHHLTRTIMY